MTDYERYLNEEEGRHLLPSFETPNLEPHMVGPVAKAIQAALEAGIIEVAATTAGRVYDRKGYTTLDRLGESRNTAYGSEIDDYFLQIAVRIPYEELEAVHDEMNRVYNAAIGGRLAEAEDRLAQAAAKERQAAEERDRLEALVAELKDSAK